MGEAGVNRIHAVFDALQPVTVLKPLNGEVHIAVADQKIIERQHRHRLGPKIGEDEAAQLLRRIGRVLDSIFESAVSLARNLEHIALGPDEPAMIFATQSCRLHRAEAQIGAAMWAKRSNDRGITGLLAEQDQILRQYPYEGRLILQMS